MKGHYIVKINNRCNSNCIFCADSEIIRRQDDFEYDKLIQDLKTNRKKFDSIIISGGEPTIYKNLLNYICYAKKELKYKKITLTTNGILLTYPDFVQKLVENGVDAFIISFITVDEKKYDAITRLKGSLKRVKKGISKINKLKKEINANIVLHKFNIDDIEKTVEYLINEGFKHIQLSYMNPVGTSVKKGKSIVALSYSKVLPNVKSAFKKAKELKYANLFIENFPICTAPDLKDKISDLKKPNINKEYYNRDKKKPEKCILCSFYSICDGPWKAYLEQFGDKEIMPILEKK